MRKDVFLGLAVAIVLLVSVAAYTLFFNNKPDAKSQTSKSTPAQQEPVKPDRFQGRPQTLIPGNSDVGIGRPDSSYSGSTTQPSPTTHSTHREPVASELRGRTWDELMSESGPSPRVAAIVPTPGGSVARPASTYTVKPGDTLWGISVSVYGNGAYTSRIIAANPGIDPNRLKAGVALHIPDKSTVVTEAGNTVPVATNINPDTQYRVVSGDNLNNIAKNLYGSTSMASKIFEANKDVLANPNNLKPGMVLKLPTPPTSAPRAIPVVSSTPAISAIER